MISIEELKEYAKIKAFNLGQAEKDYFQNLILFILYQHFGKDLIFKGGTALSKCYGSRRFSEDLDFTCLNDFDTDIVTRGLERFKIEFEKDIKKTKTSLNLILRIKGPLYIGTRQSLCKLRIDISFREKILLPPKIKTIGRFMEEIPEFDVLVMCEEEILAEKIRAILTRVKARDVYDLWFLLKQEIKPDLSLIKKKLRFYRMHWDKKKFVKAINTCSKIWKTELGPLLKDIPEFDEVRKLIFENFKITAT